MSREPVEAALRRLHEEKGEDIIATKIKAGRRLCRNETRRVLLDLGRDEAKLKGQCQTLRQPSTG